MRDIIKGLLAAVALTALASAPVKANTIIPITDGGGWNTFDFQGVGSSFQDADGNTDEFTFTLLHPDTLRVTDGFNTGDQFGVFIFDLSTFAPTVGSTSTPTLNFEDVGDCWSCAYYDPSGAYSHASFTLAAGSYVVTGNDLLSPYGAGEAALELGAVPEPASWAMMLAGFFGLGMVLRRSRSNQHLATLTV